MSEYQDPVSIFRVATSWNEMEELKYAASVELFERYKPEPKRTHFTDDFIPWSQRKLRKLLGYTKVVPFFGRYVSARPLLLVIGSEEGFPQTSQYTDRWLLQMEGSSRWRLEIIQHWPDAPPLPTLTRSFESEKAKRRLRCDARDFPILLKPGDLLFAPAMYTWEACRPKESLNAAPILMGGAGPSSQWPPVFMREIQKTYGRNVGARGSAKG